jgi:heme-degrading monooxygenase HmoA
MHAEVTHRQVRLDKVDEAVDRFRHEVLPAAKKQKGFRGIYLLVDRKTGMFMEIHLWDTERAMKEAETPEFLEQQKALFNELLVSQPTREPYEVGVRD